MGVTGLWTVVQPCARPIKIETLNKKRLAVDASIWIYQFLKAVRDKEGNALRNSHVVGFFRRICKLLFVGILPVFVFDGGAPALKRQTINNRKRRREGRREDAARTAGKLLALHMQRAAEEEEQKRKREANGRAGPPEEEAVPDADKMVYVDEITMTERERAQNRRFKRKDQYHLPDLDGNLAEMGAPNDPRIMSLEELESYARQFDSGEDINVYDFSKIDFDSPFFTSLPASDRYNILNAARLRSRLRMGYSKEQLDTMFPNRMDFSRFQIERVTERNELTQRLMNINGMNDDGMWGINGTGRIAGERGREYVLVRNEGVEGGWALGVVTSKDEGKQEKPIDVDAPSSPVLKSEDEESDEEFEDVPIEGLNRLPKIGSSAYADPDQQALQKRRKDVYASRRGRGRGITSKPARKKRHVPTATPAGDANSLFVADANSDDEQEDLFEDVPAEEQDGSDVDGTDDDDLNRAIAMSLQRDDEDEASEAIADAQPSEDPLPHALQQRRVEDVPAFKDSRAKGGRAIANLVNARANQAPRSTLFQADSDSDDDTAESDNVTRPQVTDEQSNAVKKTKEQERASNVQASVAAAAKPKSRSTNPLPFERLDLGSSLFGKKVKEMEEKTAGGFEKDSDKKKQEGQALPPWFSGDLDSGISAQKQIEQQDRDAAKKFRDEQAFEFAEPSVLRRQVSKEVIDLEAPATQGDSKEILVLDDSDDAEGEDTMSRTSEAVRKDVVQTSNDDEPITMGDLAEELKVAPVVVAPPTSDLPPVLRDVPSHNIADDDMVPDHGSVTVNEKADGQMKASTDEDNERLDWSESEAGDQPLSKAIDAGANALATNGRHTVSRSGSPEFEDIEIPDKPAAREQDLTAQSSTAIASKRHVSGLADQNAAVEQRAAIPDDEDYGLVTDSEDEELMRQLETEAQEHARFAAELNSRTTQAANVANYELELKQLRTQQKKDRRDADEVTQIMITECQQLLRLFGLPYITAPMEAEAQCAELVSLGLVDGIVTDDSDCFLFGGTRVYKNMFNQAKFVECYLLADLEREFDLSRDKLIGIAQLLGSDYTEGLPGVGPVTALEILSEFASLSDFAGWWAEVQEGRRKKEDDAAVAFRRKFRKSQATKLFLPPGFPDQRVEAAYLEPEVDSDPSPFQWGVPDLDALRAFLMATIGWNQERTDEVLVPVIRDMNRRAEEGTQANITKFFGGGVGAGAYAPRVRAQEASKRLGGALGKMADRAKRKRGKRSSKRGIDIQDEEEVEAEMEAVVNEDERMKDARSTDEAAPSSLKKSRKRKSGARDPHSEDEGSAAMPVAKKKPKRRATATRRKKPAAGDSDDYDDSNE